MQPELAASNPFSDFMGSGSMVSRISQWVRQNM
jgi:hypothetical protein